MSIRTHGFGNSCEEQNAASSKYGAFRRWLCRSGNHGAAGACESHAVRLFTRTEPHLPLDVEPFALGPFVAASLVAGAAAYVLMVRGMRHSTAIAPVFTVTALLFYMLQNYADSAFPKIWPAVIAAQLAIAVILGRAVFQAIRLVHSTGGGLA